jgi:hypothetical protein
MTRRSHRMQKYKFDVTCPGTFFAISVPPEHEKYCVNVSLPGCTAMHNVTRKPDQMQKHKFGLTCLIVFFVESGPVPSCFLSNSCLSHPSKKNNVSISHPECTRMHYVTRRSHRMQKHKFSVTCPYAFLLNPYRSHSSMKNSESTFLSPDVPECTT